MRLKREQKGITLIALIITIIVMLILVGVTISVALNGGLFTTTQQAVSETQKEADREQLLSAVVGAIGTDAKVDFSKLDSNLPTIEWTGSNGTYISPKGNTFKVSEDGTLTEEIDFTAIKQDLISNPDKYLLKAAEAGQDTNSITDIAIGTDGNVVNLGLWLYNILDNTVELTGIGSEEAGYLGEIVDGKIEGTMPQYIYSEGKIYEVTTLGFLFDGTAGLKYAPKLPETVTMIYGLFAYCEDLEVIPDLHEGLLSVEYMFSGCTGLKKVDENLIPSTVTNCTGMFYGCTGLKKVNENLIPSTVTNCSWMFASCTNLENAPIIPESVEYISYMFYNCTSLTGIITINSNLVKDADDWTILFRVGSAERPITLRGTGNNAETLKQMKKSGNSDYITIEN